MLHPETPPAARALGLAGLVPFWVAALAVVFAEGEVEAAALRAQVAYGAVMSRCARTPRPAGRGWAGA